MANTQPIKRSKELVPLSRDHHEGLLLCWKINCGLKKGIETERICKYIVHFFDCDLRQHFSEEERYIFPLLDKTNTIRVNVEAQHKKLRDIVSSFRTQPNASTDSLKQFAQLLNDHIRYEERVLFQEVERLAGAELKMIEDKLSKHNDPNLNWRDQFWLN